MSKPKGVSTSLVLRLRIYDAVPNEKVEEQVGYELDQVLRQVRDARPYLIADLSAEIRRKREEEDYD